MKIMYRTLTVLLGFALIIGSGTAMAKKKKKDNTPNDTIKSSTVSGLKWRSIGPAFTSGRIADFAVNPNNHSQWFVAVASGHIWKTDNNGTTFKPVFDNYGSYSIGCLAMDPTNEHVIWAGTGENNHQRALGYGNGVFKSVNGGKSWKNMGLKESRHIGMIAINPENSNIVYVAAEGSAWGPGGERGLYKTIDGGKNWELVLEISEHTGINNVILDPRNPELIYATAEQRRRHVHTKIGGGPESAVYKSEDGGKNFRKIMSGITGAHKGGMGIAISPVNPDVLYLIVEAANNSGGFYRSINRGESWQKMSSHASSGQYYNEIYCDPVDVDKVYSVETISHYTEDAGKTWKTLSNNGRHVDDHALWIDPNDTKHFLIGGDGGVYESFDAGKTYIFKSNLPVTQFYRVNVDNDYPFYNVYGGTQDNNSFGGPNQNKCYSGVTVGEWTVTLGGDGFWQAIDPEDPNIVYSEYQYGNSYRYDKKSGESVKIKPNPRKGEDTYRWNWNAPLILSKHNNKRLYAAANKVFRSDDQGNSWTVISEDLTAQIDRNTWPVMDRYWSESAVKKDVSTSLYGTLVSMAESTVNENLLYVGSDDGLIQRTDDMKTWTKISDFPEVPEHTYVSDILASKFDENVVYASFDNRKRDDFKPYILKSTDKGATWKSVANNLPKNGTVHTIEQDFENPDLIFVGTEFGAFFSINGGEIWTRLNAGLPDIAVRDMVIQERECDLVLATFGRGFYVLDDYSPLRTLNKELLEKDAHMFPIADALMYVRKGAKYGQGATVFFGENPSYGAVFTYYLKESPKTSKGERKKEEKKLFKDKKPIPMPTIKELRDEKLEEKPHLIFNILDNEGNLLRRITKSASKGINRITWDLRINNYRPFRSGDFSPLRINGGTLFAVPGTYKVSVDLYANGEYKNLLEPQEFVCKHLNDATIPTKDRAAVLEFQKQLGEVSKVIWGTNEFAEEIEERIQTIQKVIYGTPDIPLELAEKARAMEKEIEDILWTLNGRTPKASREENPPAAVSINERLNSVAWLRYNYTGNITGNEEQVFDILKEEFPPVLERLTKLYKDQLLPLEAEMDKYGAGYSKGRVPVWKNNWE
jgi:photosystem II stability/assembly factor-like uncharacterized protein